MILDDLYAGEISFSIVAEWDAGYRMRLGSEYGGFAATPTVNTFAQAYEWLVHRLGRTVEAEGCLTYAYYFRRGPCFSQLITPVSSSRPPSSSMRL
jgi:hypothetical protein